MALSGRVLGSFSSGVTYYQPYIFWEIQSQSITDCESKVYIEYGHYKAGTSTASHNVSDSSKLTTRIDGQIVANAVYAPFDFRSAAIGTYNKIWSTTTTVKHDETTGKKSLPISFTHVTGISLATGTVSTTAELETIARSSSIATATSSVVAGNKFNLTVSRKNTAYFHKSTFRAGLDVVATSAPFAEALSYTVPLDWLNYSGGLANTVIYVEVQTYTDSTCKTAIGAAAEMSFTVTAPNSAGPIVEDGWASARYDNSNTAAAGIAAYVQGFSKAAITFDESKIQTQYGADIKSFSVSYNGKTTSKAPYTTAVITGTKASVVCTVTDTRNISRSVTLEIDLYPYSAPTLTDVQIYRSNGAGTKAEEGTTIWAVATLNYSSVGGLNNCSLKGYYRPINGEYADASVNLQSGAGAAITNAAEISNTYMAKIVAEDALGKTVTYEVRIASASVTFTAMDGGKGAAFFKYADREGYLEVDGNFAVSGGLEVGGNFDVTGKITVPEPTEEADAASKGYVDTSIAGKTSAASLVPKYVGSTSYALTAEDNGKMISFSYAIRSEDITVTLQQSESTNMPVGAEIAIVRSWGANVTIKLNGLRVGLPGYLTTGVGGLTPTTEVSLTISKPFDTIVFKKIEQGSIDVWVVQGDVEYANINNATLTITAGQSIPISLKAGEIMQVAYLTSSQAANITLKVNGAAPDGGYYTPAQENNTYSGGIITYGGSTALATAQFSMQIVGDRLIVWGPGIRGNGTGHGTFNAFWKTTAPTAFSISHAGTVVYKKIQ